MESKINLIEEDKANELQQLKNYLKIEYDADKKMALADMKLELAEIKSKYAEALTELNTVRTSQDKKTK